MYVELGMNCKRFAFSLYFLVFFFFNPDVLSKWTFFSGKPLFHKL